MRTVHVLLLAVALLGVSAGCRAAGEDGWGEPTSPEIVRYTALGDSLATGAGAGTSYVAEYAAWLRTTTGSTVQITNLAVNGWTSQDLLDALTSDTAMRAAVADADVLTWNIGTNDVVAAWSSAVRNAGGPAGDHDGAPRAVDTAIVNIGAVFDELLDIRENEVDGLRTLDLYLPYTQDPDLAPHLEEFRPHLEEFNRRLRQSAQDRGIAVAEVAVAFHGPDGTGDPVLRGLIADDGLHPSDRGHELIARELAALDPGSGDQR